MLRLRQIPDVSFLFSSKQMQIGPHDVELVTERERVQLLWSNIHEIDSDRERIYLYMTPTNALFVPKRAFSSVEVAQAFEAQARAYRADPYTNGDSSVTPADSAVWPPPPQPKAFDEPELEPDDVPGSFQIQYVTQKADLWRSQIYFLSHCPLYLLNITIPCAFAAGIWAVGRLPLLAALLWTIIGAFAATFLTLAWTTQRALSRRCAKYPDGRPCRTIVLPDMLCDVTPEGKTMHRWSEIQAARYCFGDIYILVKGNRGIVIPRAAFPSQTSCQEFAEIMERFRREALKTEGQRIQAPSIT